jgi:hypothetical protein
LLDALRVGEGSDLVRELAQWALQQLIEVEATERIGAEAWERAEGRVTHRNGHRLRTLSTKAGDLQVGIPKLRKGSFFPELLEPRRRIDQALYAVIMEAYVNGVSTRSVDDLVAAMGVDTGISKSEVSRICAGLDERVAAFRGRTLGHVAFPYVYLDATYVHVRDDALGQVVSRRQRGRDVLDPVPAGPARPRPRRRATGDLRRPRRPSRRDHQVLHRRFLATVPGPLRPQPARHRPQPPSCSPAPAPTCWRSPRSRERTGARSGRTTRSNG